jgi:hypothetical protein
VIASLEPARPGSEQGDEYQAREIESSGSYVGLLPVDQRSVAAVVEEVAGAGVPMGQDERAGPRDLRGREKLPVRDGCGEQGEPIAQVAETLRVLLAERRSRTGNWLFGATGLPTRASACPIRRHPFSVVGGSPGRRSVAGEALTINHGRAGCQQPRRRTAVHGELSQRLFLALQRAWDALELDGHWFLGLPQSSEQDLMPGSLRRSGLNANRRAVVDEYFFLHAGDDPLARLSTQSRG